MKYINSYKLFESLKDIDIDEQVKDILQDLTDEGFNIEVNLSAKPTSHTLRDYYQLNININKMNMEDDMNYRISASRFTYSEIQKPIEHLLSFLKQSLYEMDSAHASLNYLSMPFSFDMVKGSDEMGRFQLRFIRYKSY